ncbi:hypothetical protein RO575_22650 [Methylomonas sp. MO1]|uniref:DUF7689 domain-containing protein n=1 Tax=Methylomonas sp. MO1 TaxID=3073619 RepID=UPI0028A4B858|nr:hypothetical protein [Methylomonas sp. MO1]MDT4292376.1 hypothetical protein [Methylomonas sp. MO1]
MMTRQMTQQEKSQFKGWFPNLDVNAAVVTGEPTQTYNCISWTLGVTDRWLWPGASIASFDTFYRQWGFSRSGSRHIAAWGSSASSMTHGCVSGSCPRWESKCGNSLSIQHGLTELEGANYGRVSAFYNRAGIAAPFAEAFAESLSSGEQELMKLSEQEETNLKKDISNVPEEIQIAFQDAFAAWKKTWFSGSLAIDSNPYSRSRCKEFDDLVALGQQIIPLVIETLTEDENFFSLVLYDSIQSDSRFIVQYEPDDLRLLQGEQGRAIYVVKSWLAR